MERTYGAFTNDQKHRKRKMFWRSDAVANQPHNTNRKCKHFALLMGGICRRMIQKKMYNVEDYKEFREFKEEDFVDVQGIDDGPYTLRHYLPWAMEHYGSWLKDFQKQAVIYESMIRVLKMNNEMPRQDIEVFEAFTQYSGYTYKHMSDKYTEIMDKEFEKDIAILSDNIVVHRVTTKKIFYQRIGTERLRINDVVRLEGFLSTSLVETLLINGIEYKDGYDLYLKIYAPKGCRCIFIEYISHRFQEQEMLFARNQKIRILNIENEGKVTNITATIVLD